MREMSGEPLRTWPDVQSFWPVMMLHKLQVYLFLWMEAVVLNDGVYSIQLPDNHESDVALVYALCHISWLWRGPSQSIAN